LLTQTLKEDETVTDGEVGLLDLEGVVAIEHGHLVVHEFDGSFPLDVVALELFATVERHVVNCGSFGQLFIDFGCVLLGQLKSVVPIQAKGETAQEVVSNNLIAAGLMKMQRGVQGISINIGILLYFRLVAHE
jgi:hypothetical protein